MTWKKNKQGTEHSKFISRAEALLTTHPFHCCSDTVVSNTDCSIKPWAKSTNTQTACVSISTAI